MKLVANSAGMDFDVQTSMEVRGPSGEYLYSAGDMTPEKVAKEAEKGNHVKVVNQFVCLTCETVVDDMENHTTDECQTALTDPDR